jgi:hypothetical protein
MTILYRTPNIVINEFEWHATVEVRFRRVMRCFRFRPLSHYVKAVMWFPIVEWKGHKPQADQFRKAFEPYRLHMQRAEQSVGSCIFR